MPRKDQFSGCLIGQCLGDALGFPVEGYPPAFCRSYVNDYLKKGRAGELGRGSFPFGQYTDDSQLARELVQSFMTSRGFDPEDYAQRIAAIFKDGRIVGYGGATMTAARRLIQGVSWEESGTPPPSAGNGSAMRAGPIGLFFYDQPPKLIQAAHDQGRITHKDHRCSAGAVAIAGAVSLALQNESIENGQFIIRLARLVEGFDDTFSRGIRNLEEWVSLPPEKAVKYISTVGLEPDFIDRWQGISPFVVGSVLWSLYSFLRSPKDYWGTICTAISVGGDVDTTAAMAGAVSGAHLGLEALPSNLAYRINDQGTWTYDELVQLAHGCYEVKIQL